MDGPTGLDYAGVWLLIERHTGNRKRRADALYFVQAMEEATLGVWREMRASSRA